MTAPTLVSTSGSNWGDASATDTTGSLSWIASDKVIVVAMTADNTNTLNVPTVTGLTGTGLTFTQLLATNTVNSCKGYIWTADAAGTGSGTIQATSSSGGTPSNGIQAAVWRGHGGLGASTSTATGSATTIALSGTGSDSGIMWAAGDWSATNDVIVSPSPAGGTQRQAVFVTGQATFFAFDWVGVAGNQSFGITGFAGNPITKVVVEILGVAGSSPNPLPPLVAVGAAATRATTW